MADHVTGITLRDVRKLLDQKLIDDAPLDAVSKIIDAVVLLSPVVAGPAVGVTLLPLLDVKNVLVDFGRDAIKKLAKPKPDDYLAQATRLAAANCLLTYTAFFDAAQQVLAGPLAGVTLSAADKQRIAANEETGLDRKVRLSVVGESLLAANLADQLIAVPHPVGDGGEQTVRRALYRTMTIRLVEKLANLSSQPRIDPARVQELLDRVAERAEALYQAELAGLALDFPQFLIWLVLTDQVAKDALIRKVGADVRMQFELVGRALDLGLADLATQLAGIRQTLAVIGAPVGEHRSDPDLAVVAGRLHTVYVAQIRKPVIDDSYEPTAGPKLSYPTREESYVPQAYRLARHDGVGLHLESDDAWSIRPIGDDLGWFLLRHLESAFSTRLPLLILGHPGSGKSLLTRMLAARLGYPGYTTIRVELRDVDPKMSIQQQIEAQILADSGDAVSWPRFAQAMPAPPVVILDGYDELLQATGSTHADYLARVQEFQEREADLGSPIRMLVTSRITLIDKVSVPAGTTIVRLEEFDRPRSEAWAEVWNQHNAAYFAASVVRPFQVPGGSRLAELAAQPLLLLMLALYDSAANELQGQLSMDQTRLYHELLSRFIRRELDKDKAGFRRLPAAQQEARIASELDRLGVVAIGMFNRQALLARGDELDRDLRYFTAAAPGPAPGGGVLSPAELLLGSFFFVHVSRSRLAEAPDDPAAGPAAFEFLHKTFGEFLTADFIVRQIISQAQIVARLAADPALAELLDQRLNALNKNWFGCLVHTPLHTQPNVLALLREWGRHRLETDVVSPANLLAAVDQIIVAQLKGLLAATTPLDLTTQDRDVPYPPQPAFAHLAIYSLNLILVRAYLCGRDEYVLDEADLADDQPETAPPWDRLTALWRSWFPVKSLAALAACFHSIRRESLITIKPTQSPLAVESAASFATAYHVALAFGDDATATSLGLHVAALDVMDVDFLERLAGNVNPNATDLRAILRVIQARTLGDWGGMAHLLGHLGGGHFRLWSYSGNRAFGRLPPGLAVDIAEMSDRLLLSAAQREDSYAGRAEITGLAGMSRYEAELTVSLLNSRQPRWLTQGVPADVGWWSELLRGPAGAPFLRALLRGDIADYHLLAEAIEAALGGEITSIYDVDTAVSIVITASRAGSASLCLRVLNHLIQTCDPTGSRAGWRPSDIPSELWGPFADVVVAETPHIRRRELARLIRQDRYGRQGGASGMSVVELIGADELDESVVHQLRICTGFPNEPPVGPSESIATIDQCMARGWKAKAFFLALIRWARENGHNEHLVTLFRADPNGYSWRQVLGVPSDVTLRTLDLEAVSMNLSYREAMDLRWAVDVVRRQAGADRPSST